MWRAWRSCSALVEPLSIPPLLPARRSQKVTLNTGSEPRVVLTATEQCTRNFSPTSLQHLEANTPAGDTVVSKEAGVVALAAKPSSCSLVNRATLASATGEYPESPGACHPPVVLALFDERGDEVKPPVAARVWHFKLEVFVTRDIRTPACARHISLVFAVGSRRLSFPVSGWTNAQIGDPVGDITSTLWSSHRPSSLVE